MVMASPGVIDRSAGLQASSPAALSPNPRGRGVLASHHRPPGRNLSDTTSDRGSGQSPAGQDLQRLKTTGTTAPPTTTLSARSAPAAWGLVFSQTTNPQADLPIEQWAFRPMSNG